MSAFVSRRLAVSWRSAFQRRAANTAGAAFALTIAAMTLASTSRAAEPAAGTPSALQLDKAVILMRHGVRSPNQTVAELAKSARREWPTWPIGPGELTEHGARLVSVMGAYYRQHYAQAGLFPAAGCVEGNEIAVWADNSSRRIPLSGQALLDGMLPGCNPHVGYAPQTAADPLFHPAELGACPISPAKARASITRAANGDIERAASVQHEAMHKLQEILEVRSRARCRDDVPSCGIDGFANVFEDGKDGWKLEGGLKAATTVSENFYLEYVEGFPEKDIGWGDAAKPEVLSLLMGPRNLYLKLTRQAPYMAAHGGTSLAKALLEDLETDTPRAISDPTQPPHASKFKLFMGRDYQLAAISGLLGLQWNALPGQPDNFAPGLAIALERLHSADGKRYVRPVLYYQTIQQMRAGIAAHDAANPPGRVVLRIPGCEKDEVDGACGLPTLRAKLEAGYATDCGA